MKMKSISVAGQSISYLSESTHWVFKIGSGIVKLSKANHASIKEAVKKAVGLM